jgi:hypothetical protein
MFHDRREKDDDGDDVMSLLAVGEGCCRGCRAGNIETLAFSRADEEVEHEEEEWYLDIGICVCGPTLFLLVAAKDDTACIADTCNSSDTKCMVVMNAT